MKVTRGRLSYANVLSTLCLFLLLGGGAYAAFKLPKNSVGSKQLKKNSVTTAKIKKNAVTTAKIKGGAVNGNTVADGSLTAADLNVGSLPFSRIVHQARGTTTLPVTETNQVYPLNSASYTQGPNEDDTYLGAVDVTIPSTCTFPRGVTVWLAVDAIDPAHPGEAEIVGQETYESGSNETVHTRVYLRTFGGRIGLGEAMDHTLSIAIEGTCKTGGGITATSGAVDVIGTTS